MMLAPVRFAKVAAPSRVQRNNSLGERMRRGYVMVRSKITPNQKTGKRLGKMIVRMKFSLRAALV
jgi:ribosomal protein L15E